MDVKVWLRDLGLSRYAGAFADNDIDADALAKLTNEDLKELGVNSLGHRKKLLAGIAARSETIDEQGETSPSSGAVAVASNDAERRQITVMFCDMVGSTELSRRLDPEDLREVLRRYQDAVTAAVTRYEGYVARFMGDGVLVYFGWPQAHEDQAERAVRAGLVAVNAVEGIRLNGGQQLQARVGIATGQVVIGDLIGEGGSEEAAITGEAPNLAARLQAVAAPGQAVIGANTRILIGDTFDLEDLGTHEMKGFAEPVAAWNVVGEHAPGSRFEAMHKHTLGPLVGRDEELDILLRRWECAKEGEGQVVLISGESGIGKSRLCETVRDRIAGKPHTRLLYQCSPHHVDSPLYPVITQLTRAAGFEHEGQPADKLERLESLLRQSTDRLNNTLPLFAALLSVPTGDGYAPLTLDAQQQKERTLTVVMQQLEGLATRQPVLSIFEDIHWVDPSTKELLDRLVERVETLPVLMLVTFRPEFRPPWTGQPHVSSMVLKRLSRRLSRAMVAEEVGAHDLSPEQQEEIIAKTDGVPLYIEEFTRTVLEAAEQDGISADRVIAPTVPATLQDSLMARLDRLTIGKRVAQTGSAIGREFTHDLLRSVSELKAHELECGLDELVDCGLVFRRGARPTTIYIFKHALLQDAAYSSLLLANRRLLHRRIAEVLTANSADQAALLAYHWERAENIEKALQCRLKALEKSIKLSARREAIAQYWAALALLEQMPETQETRMRHVDAVVTILPASFGFWRNAQERARALQHVDKAIDVAAKGGDLATIARLGAFKGSNSNDEALLAKAVKDAEASGDMEVQAEVAQRYAAYFGETGRFEDSYTHVARAIEIFGQLGEKVRQGKAMASEGRCYTARSGRLDASLRYANRVRQIADTTDDLGLKLWIAMEAEPYMYKGLWSKTVQVAKEGLPFAWETGSLGNILYSSAWAAIACVKLGHLEDARALLEKALSGPDRVIGAVVTRIYPRIALSQLQIACGDTQSAIATALQALEFAMSGNYHPEQGAVQRTLGQAYEAAGDRQNAEIQLRKSVEVLGKIQSRPELAQSLLSYGRFKLEDNADKGKRLLKRALRIFEEIDATGWIDETRVALGEE